MKFGSCPEFISDCYSYDEYILANANDKDLSCQMLSDTMATMHLNDLQSLRNNVASSTRASQRGSNASTDNTSWSVNISDDKNNCGIFNKELVISASTVEYDNEELVQDEFSLQEQGYPNKADLESNISGFIGAGHYSGFAGQYVGVEEENDDDNGNEIYEKHGNSDGNDELPSVNLQNMVAEYLPDSSMEGMTNTLDTLNNSNINISQVYMMLKYGSTIEDLTLLLEKWCLEGPYCTDQEIQNTNGKWISIESTVSCTLEEWNTIALAMKQELKTNVTKSSLVNGCPMKRYYGDLYPNNGRDEFQAQIIR